MSKPIYLNSQKNRGNNIKLQVIILGLCVFVILSFGILYWIHQHETPNLENSWRSEETGVVLTFTSKGDVTFKNNLPSGTYHIVSPNTMEYTIDNKTFLMTYRIEDKKLYWGLNESALECFSRYY